MEDLNNEMEEELRKKLKCTRIYSWICFGIKCFKVYNYGST